MINWLFGNRCLECDLSLNKKEPYGLCPICASQLFDRLAVNSLELEFYERFSNEIHVNEATILFPMIKNSMVKKIIHEFKYKNRPDLAIACGELLGKQLYQKPTIDYIIPVPIHHRRKLQRGYNQAEKIAQGISKFLPDSKIISLKRTQYTQTQTKLSKNKRIKNVNHVFDIKNNHNLKDKNILILDDVITTGATLKAITDLIKAYSPAHIHFAAIAMSK